MERIILDCEVYSNYFLCTIKRLKDHSLHYYEIYNNNVSNNFDRLSLIMSNCEIISFNGIKYDYPIIETAINNRDNAIIKKVSDDIIVNNIRHWANRKWLNNAIDLIEPAPAVNTGLKMYQARMHFHNLQELPIDPNAVLTVEQCKQIKDYCINDIDATEMLYNQIKPVIELRDNISKDIGINVKSKSDAQIAETTIKNELQKYNIDCYRDVNVIDTKSFKYIPPKYIKFKSKELNEFFNLVKNTEFKVDDNGKINLPKELSKKIPYGNNSYKFGIGGIHDNNTCTSYYSNDEYYVSLRDVTSYYPNVIINNAYYPKHLTIKFLEIYEEFYNKRIALKKEVAILKKELKEQRITELKEKIRIKQLQCDAYKLKCNGSFGKFGSKYSFLYSPELLIHTTLTGQLNLLMLIEKLEDNNIDVISANTDGIVCKVHKSKKELYEKICNHWEKHTNLNLEEDLYKSIHIRDVNNYVGVARDGSITRKGCFAESTLRKSPAYQVIYDSVCEYLSNNTPIEYYINKCNDITKFINARRVTGGGVWKGENVGKLVRFFKSKDGDSIHYIKNGNKVATSDNAYICLNLNAEDYITKVDKKWYINEAYKLLSQLNVREEFRI